MKSYHRLPLRTILQELDTNENGLSLTKVNERLELYGPNLLEAPKKVNPIIKFLKQFANLLIVILIITGIICFFIPDHFTDGIVIFLVVVLNAIIGYIQEYRAEKAIFALKRLSAQEANVIRDGKTSKVSAADLVRGDLIIISAGNKIPADCRVLSEDSLEIDESILTGESLPVSKNAKDEPKDLPLADRKNMLYMGTIVTAGEGRGIVVESGMGTEIGQITKIVMEEESVNTPLTNQLNSLGKFLALFALCIGIILFFLVWYNRSFELTFNALVDPLLTGISIMVAVIPEGLPVVVALTLTIGMQMMAKRNAIVRRLTGVETLGCTTYICTDKTGTLTKNEMTVKKLYQDGKLYEVSGEGYSSIGEYFYSKSRIKPLQNSGLEKILKFGLLCNDVKLVKNKENETIGSPTDRAIFYASLKSGFKYNEVLNSLPQFAKIPFSSEKKFMVTFHSIPNNDHVLVLIKGAPETILDLCKFEYSNDQEVPLFDKKIKTIQNMNLKLGMQSFRVISVAYSKIKLNELIIPSKTDQKNMKEFLRQTIKFTFIGMFALWDPPRPEVKASIKLCNSAGINVVMVTGDQPATAIAVGKKIGLYKKGDPIMTGLDLDVIKPKRFEKVVKDIRIFARVSPQHKTKIVNSLKRHGEVVAMTGDGVNDAPALAKADIGIAMGIGSSDVARDASTMILTDNNFATIVNAVEEGRKIYSNIKRFVRYQVSTNIGAILLFILAITMGLPIPLFPVLLLWINLLIDGPPAIALGMEPVTQNVMNLPPRPKKEHILKPEIILSILLLGSVMAIGTIFVFKFGLDTYGYTETGIKTARTIAFTTFVIFQLLNVLNCKSETESIFSKNIISNKFILLAIVVCLLLQLLIIYVPVVQNIFHTAPLNLIDWGLILSIVVSIIIVEEISKYIRRNQLH